MPRTLCSAQDIQDLVAYRIRELPSLQQALDEVTVCTPVRVAADANGCNWNIEVRGVPLDADYDVGEIVRITRTYVNIDDAAYALELDNLQAVPGGFAARGLAGLMPQ